jgi:hypothetical protein
MKQYESKWGIGDEIYFNPKEFKHGKHRRKEKHFGEIIGVHFGRYNTFFDVLDEYHNVHNRIGLDDVISLGDGFYPSNNSAYSQHFSNRINRDGVSSRSEEAYTNQGLDGLDSYARESAVNVGHGGLSSHLEEAVSNIGSGGLYSQAVEANTDISFTTPEKI